mmetsp:Transcript_32071/g.37697  ORF Transcript_32071/g.37697 Transcript_32071/m.37697 type:complete len:376 (+) Transcript_32071:52-1179(+)|eukprot:CAMPEP_0114346268 /NCGR_PEP_ID=MMETSP0101-20121206/12914_1 /TAXON_ID=38822 ORGANISM="Pteridomonas danica, Strain PT" /NCGR_SAMPLE_ID=MMETSP0101 /ASSEMBLY_ACC=CAM_ASM_000211 /LENGTH=375 /DNA_ID=CAMNT_0001482775 /DNA_START=56 /DNA_END=1183 /DNA_ORIENTATION=+
MNANITILPEDDPAALKCAANLIARFTNRMLNPPRFPSHHESNVLENLQRDLKTKFGTTDNSTDGEKLLKQLWLAFYGPTVPYARYSKKWGNMGFQHNKDPTSDFRGGGILSLQCLVYFFEKQPAIAKHMFSERSVRIGKRGEFANYPFACAGITLVKRLCELLMICEPLTGKVTSAYQETPLTFWQVAGSRIAFYELFVWSFMVLDKVWDEMGATYMNFGTVIRIVMQRIENVLLRLPNDVVPSSRSYMIDDCYDYQSSLDQCIFEELSMTIEDNDDDSEEDEKEERKEEEDISMSQQGENKKNFSMVSLDVDSNTFQNVECLTGDLLGLDSYVYQPQSTHYQQPTHQSDSEYSESSQYTLPSPNFFEEFGLDH